MNSKQLTWAGVIIIGAYVIINSAKSYQQEKNKSDPGAGKNCDRKADRLAKRVSGDAWFFNNEKEYLEAYQAAYDECMGSVV